MLVTLKTWKAKDIIYYYFIIFGVTCEQALRIGRNKRASGEAVRGRGKELSFLSPLTADCFMHFVWVSLKAWHLGGSTKH